MSGDERLKAGVRALTHAAPVHRSARLIVNCDWADAPHLTEDEKRIRLETTAPYMRDARSKGIPSLGSGVVYPVQESEVKVNDFEIPKHWLWAWGMDAGGGAKATAAVFACLNRETDIAYITSVYKRASAEIRLHADAFEKRGAKWMPGVGDCSALYMTADDVAQLLTLYQDYGLDLTLADKAVETGIDEVWTRLSTGRLKVFASCTAWFEEYRFYRRDEKGRIVKKNDHVMDATRYLVHAGLRSARRKPVRRDEAPSGRAGQHDWMKQ